MSLLPTQNTMAIIRKFNKTKWINDFAYACTALSKTLKMPLSGPGHMLVGGRAGTRHTAANIAADDEA